MSGRSPHPRPDQERTTPPLMHPLAYDVAGVGHRGLNCRVSFGDTVSVVRGVARGVTPGICGTKGDVGEKSVTSP